jgi:CubicO group peptidase (beta-lactamase class C family)
VNAILALAIVVGAAQAPQVSDPFMTDRVAGPLGKELDTRLKRFTRYGFSGTVLVVRRNRVVLLKGYGLANIERGIPNTGATRFEMNSMTKMFTGVAILQLAAGGHLRLRDPVARYLRDLPPSKQGATIEQLGAHTSCLVVK